MAGWDIRPLSREALAARLCAHYTEEWFPANTPLRWEFDHTENGAYDLLPGAGIFDTIECGALVFYAGAILPSDHHAPHQHRQFEYEPLSDDDDAQAQESDEGGDGGSTDGSADHAALAADEHRADDPMAVAPRQNQQVWLGEVREVVSVPADGTDADGQLRRSYLIMRGYATGLYLRSELAGRVGPIENLVNNMHGREHIKLDTWEFCRVHDIVAVADSVALDDALTHPPPPLVTTTKARAFITPGVVHYVDELRNASSHHPLVHRRPHGYSPIACEYENCASRDYDRGDHEFAQCVVCSSWFHAREPCLTLADANAEWVRLRVDWDDGQLQAPPIRREPNMEPAEFVPAARGMWIRVDVPVRTWGRAADAVRAANVDVLQELDPVSSTDGARFKTRCRERAQDGGAWGGFLTETEGEEVVEHLQAPAHPGSWILYECRACHNIM